MGKLKLGLLIFVLNFSINAFLFSSETIRISVISLKNFGDTKAGKEAHLHFIASRIADQAIKGVTVVDELQDIDQSAMKKLLTAVRSVAHDSINLILSDRVGDKRQEQFGFFWNTKLLDTLGAVQILNSNIFDRDPAFISFKANAGFDFTLCAFHTKPDGKPNELRKELGQLDDIFKQIQDMDENENDIIFVGDFNAPPDKLSQTGQNICITDSLGDMTSSMKFVIRDVPTNLKQSKVYDNIFFELSNTTEYVEGPQHVIRLDSMLDEFTGEIEGDYSLKWFNDNVMDHCPIYAVFRADIDDD